MTHTDTKTGNECGQDDLWASFRGDISDPAALERMIEAYMPLARKVLLRLMIRLPQHIKPEDLLNSALIGLHEAITRFEPGRGIAFETFATARIRGAVLDELRCMDPLSRTQRTALAQVQKAITEWMMAHNDLPDIGNIAESLDTTAEKLNELLEIAQPWISINDSIIVGGHRTLVANLLADEARDRPDHETSRRDMLALMRKFFRQLESREQKILYLYYYEELTLKEIAMVFELTEARICQIHALAIQKLKAGLTRLEKYDTQHAAAAASVNQSEENEPQIAETTNG